METVTDWESLSAEASRDRRRERRIPLVFPIEVSGFDRRGRFFTERTKTSDVSANGCRFHMNTEIARGAVVAIKLVSRNSQQSLPDRPLLFQVARLEKEDHGWVLGAAKLQPENLWCIAFPPLTQQLTPVA
jgi:hypothetical protein